MADLHYVAIQGLSNALLAGNLPGQGAKRVAQALVNSFSFGFHEGLLAIQGLSSALLAGKLPGDQIGPVVSALVTARERQRGNLSSCRQGLRSTNG